MTGTFDILETAVSTNETLKKIAAESFSEDFKAVVTFNQTEGRGQAGNNWYSGRDENISYSIIFKPLLPVQNQFLISQAVALAVTTFLEKYTGGIQIKWPNDIFIDNKKIAGILIENSLKGQKIENSIVGIGVNINQEVFDNSLPDAVSLMYITGNKYDLNQLSNELHNQVIKYLDNLTIDKAGEIERFYINSLLRRDGLHEYKDASGYFKARIKGIGSQGNLILELEDFSIRSYFFKEVTFVF